MQKYLVFFIPIVLGWSNLHAAEDEQISILKKEVTYSYKYNSKNQKLEVTESTHLEFKSNYSGINIRYPVFYNDQSSIESYSANSSIKGKISLRPSCGSYQDGSIFHSDAKVCVYNLYFNRKDEIISLDYTQEIIDAKYAPLHYFSDNFSVGHSTLIYEVPTWLSLNVKEFNLPAGIKPIVTKGKKATTYTYHVENLEDSKAKGFLPGPSYYQPHIMFLYQKVEDKSGDLELLPDTEALYGWYKSLVSSIYDDTKSIKDFATTLKENATTDEEIIKNVFYWNQDKVRYVAFEDGLAGFQPEASKEVLAQLYGDCKGKANLTKNLLNSLGFDARLAWVGTSRLVYDYTTPSLAVDNHMVCVLINKGDTVVLDATETFNAYKDYAERIQGRQLLVEHGNDYFYYHVPTYAATRNKLQNVLTLKFDNGHLVGSGEIVALGETKGQLLRVCNGVNNEGTERFLTNYVQSRFDDSKVTSLKFTNLQDRENPFKVNYDLELNKAGQEFEGVWYVSLPNFSEPILSMDDEDRKESIFFNEKIHRNYKVVIDLGGHKLLHKPEDVIINRADYSIKAESILARGNKLEVNVEVKVPKGKIPNTELHNWFADSKEIRSYFKQQLEVKN